MAIDKGQISKEKLAKFVTEDLGDIDEYIKQIGKFILNLKQK